MTKHQLSNIYSDGEFLFINLHTGLDKLNTLVEPLSEYFTNADVRKRELSLVENIIKAIYENGECATSIELPKHITKSKHPENIFFGVIENANGEFVVEFE